MAVVDHVNYITVSITLALAWALPSEPPSELLELTKDRLRNVIEQPPTKQPLVIDDALKAGTPSIKRIADTSSRVPFNDITRSRFVPSSIGQSFRIPSHQYLDIQVQNKNPFSWDRLHSTSTKSNPFYQPISKSNHLNYPWWRYVRILDLRNYHSVKDIFPCLVCKIMSGSFSRNPFLRYCHINNHIAITVSFPSSANKQ